MQGPKRVLLVPSLVLLAGLVAGMAAAGEPVLKAYAGANGVWYNAAVDASPSDFELGGNVRASLSPHISAVSAAYYGFGHSYVRGSVGARFTATDVDNRWFSVGLGIQYHVSSEPDIRPEEWAPDVSIGYVAWPEKAPDLVLIAQSGYGLSSKEAFVMAGVRYCFWKGASL